MGSGRGNLGRLAMGVVALGLLACGKTSKPSTRSDAEAGQPGVDSAAGPPAPLDGSFAVSDYFTPSANMGDGSVGRVTALENERCKERPPDAAGDCYRFEYQVGAVSWAGAAWLYPQNNYGSVPGHPFERAAFQRVRFSAAVLEAPEQVTFFIGGIRGSNAIPPQPYNDSFQAEGSFTLTSDWQSLSLDIPPILAQAKAQQAS